MIENQFWWANIDGYDDDEAVEVRVEHGKPLSICFAGSEIGIAAENFDRHGVRLIERVLPAGRATAVDALADAMWQCLDDMGEHGQGVCLVAKAKAWVAYEPFRIDAVGEEAPLDYPLEAAQAVITDLEWQRARMAGRTP